MNIPVGVNKRREKDWNNNNPTREYTIYIDEDELSLSLNFVTNNDSFIVIRSYYISLEVSTRINGKIRRKKFIKKLSDSHFNV